MYINRKEGITVDYNDARQLVVDALEHSLSMIFNQKFRNFYLGLNDREFIDLVLLNSTSESRAKYLEIINWLLDKSNQANDNSRKGFIVDKKLLEELSEKTDAYANEISIFELQTNLARQYLMKREDIDPVEASMLARQIVAENRDALKVFEEQHDNDLNEIYINNKDRLEKELSNQLAAIQKRLEIEMTERITKLEEYFQTIHAGARFSGYGKNRTKFNALMRNHDKLSRDNQAELKKWYYANSVHLNRWIWGNWNIRLSSFSEMIYADAGNLMIASNIIQNPEKRFEIASRAKALQETVKQNSIPRKLTSELGRAFGYCLIGVAVGLTVALAAPLVIPAAAVALAITGFIFAGAAGIAASLCGIFALEGKFHTEKLHKREIKSIKNQLNENSGFQKANNFITRYSISPQKVLEERLASRQTRTDHRWGRRVRSLPTSSSLLFQKERETRVEKEGIEMMPLKTTAPKKPPKSPKSK